jgi:hypothetical protein
MANYLAQFQTIKSSCDRIVIAVEDVSDLWLNVKESFQQRLPVKKACLNNKARNPVLVENLPAEFIQTTDSRLRSRFPQEQYLFCSVSHMLLLFLLLARILMSSKPFLSLASN